MLVRESRRVSIGIPAALRGMAMACAIIGIAGVLFSTVAYVSTHSDFSLTTTFLSDIGDTAGWPQIFFNASMILISPLRYLVLVLVAMRLVQFGAGRTFAGAVLIIGFVATLGTVMMTAVPFSQGPTVHKAGIGLYFLGVVFLQSIIFGREWKLEAVPRILPLLSMGMVFVYFLFLGAIMRYEFAGSGRSLAVALEWLCATISIVWVVAHGILLGRD